INVDPPSIEDTIKILTGLREKYEAHHKVKYSDESLKAAAELSERYIPDRFLPDKAIDLIDESGSRARLQLSTMPKTIKDREGELEALTKDKDNAIASQEYEKAARLRDQEKELKKSIEEQKKKWRASREETIPTISEEDIASVVSMW